MTTVKLAAEQVPIAEMLEAYRHEQTLRMHMPGHKGQLSEWDITEIPGSDDLHQPTSEIAQAQALAARAFGAAETFFLVNGSTVGLMALLWALPRQKTVVIARDCHRSALQGLVLAGLKPVWVWPDGLVSDSDIEKALANTDASAVLITRPDYYGRCADIEKIAQVTERHNVRLLVDEAHGAHFSFSPLLPSSASGWADGWVQSAHKTLPALTQTAYLHLSQKGAALSRSVREGLTLMQTSSPSYPLMASLDQARAYMQKEGGERLACLIGDCEIFVRTVPHAWPTFERDPTRLVVEVGDGHAAEKQLRSLGVQVEMADMTRVVGIATVADDSAAISRFADAVLRLPVYTKRTVQPIPMPEARMIMTPREAMEQAHETVFLKQAAGRVCAVAAGTYPPGIPLLMPGELIERVHIEYFEQVSGLGGRFFGLRNGLEVLC